MFVLGWASLICCVDGQAEAPEPHGHAAKAALLQIAAKDPMGELDSYAQLDERDKEFWVRIRRARSERTQGALIPLQKDALLPKP